VEALPFRVKVPLNTVQANAVEDKAMTAAKVTKGTDSVLRVIFSPYLVGIAFLLFEDVLGTAAAAPPGPVLQPGSG
ncbi:MAG: hypothetical protein M3P85_02750, partial [Actinomycetota bacterium]|nr:hypothetical protein [Actinomycetota bacterium]